MGGHNNLLMAESYLDWWTLVGVDSLVDEMPAGWLHAPAPSAADAAANDNGSVKPPTRILAPEPPPLPDILLKKSDDQHVAPKLPAIFPEEWDDFQHWLLHADDVPGSQWDGRRVLPLGQQGARFMLITAWPEMDEQRAGQAFFGDAGLLLDRMLQAIGLIREQVYIASLAITRPAGGRCDAQDLPEMQRLLRHHIRLCGPHNLICIGHDITQIMAGERLQALRGRLWQSEQDGRTIPAIAIPHPAIMLSRPALKAAAWDSLKRLTSGT